MKTLFAAAFLPLIPAVAAEAILYAPMAKDSFVVDGQLEENTYAGYDWSTPFHVLDRESATVNGLYAPVEASFQSLKTVAGVFRDEASFYAVFMAPTDKGSPLGEDDRVGLAISADGRSVLVITCDSRGKVEAARLGDGLSRTEVDARSVKAGVRSKKDLTVELKIPFELIGARPGAKGCTWRCNLFRTGKSCGGRASWTSMSPQTRFWDAENLGSVVFDARKLGTEPILPENAEKKTFLWQGARWGEGDMKAQAPLDESELKVVRLSGPQGARAVAHFRVSNLTDAHRLYTLNTDDYLKNEFARRVRFREMSYVELRGGPTRPDPIFDLPNGSVLRLPPRTTAIVWVDVDTTGMKPGLHKAKLHLVPGYSNGWPKMETKDLDLELTVGKADVSEIDLPNWAYAIRWPKDYLALRDYRFNVICMGPFQYNCKNKDGSRDWKLFDEAVETVISTGVKTNQVRLLFYHLFPEWCNKNTYATPAFEEEIVTSIREAVNYAKSRWGIGYDRLYFSAKDEPNGDPDDPKSSAWNAFYGVKLAKRADPQLKNFTNPWKSEPEYLSRYLETFDALEPYLGRIVNTPPETPSRYVKGCKEVWSYSILLKQNLPSQYRKASWTNLSYGFNGPAVFYDLFDCAGDPFDSYDRNGGPDYNAAYKDKRTELASPSRRLEAWYLGTVELKLVFWCYRRLELMRAAGKASAAGTFTARIDALILRAVGARPDFDAIGRDLLKISDEIAEVR